MQSGFEHVTVIKNHRFWNVGLIGLTPRKYSVFQMQFSDIQLTQDNISMNSLCQERGFFLYFEDISHPVISIISEKWKSWHAFYKVFLIIIVDSLSTPWFKDHLSIKTTFALSQRWSLSQGLAIVPSCLSNDIDRSPTFGNHLQRPKL